MAAMGGQVGRREHKSGADPLDDDLAVDRLSAPPFHLKPAGRESGPAGDQPLLPARFDGLSGLGNPRVGQASDALHDPSNLVAVASFVVVPDV